MTRRDPLTFGRREVRRPLTQAERDRQGCFRCAVGCAILALVFAGLAVRTDALWTYVATVAALVAMFCFGDHEA